MQNAAEGIPQITIALSFVLPPPEELADDPIVIFCSPGGAIGKGYFDLNAEDDYSFSFAESMVRRGWITVSIDHPGIGASEKPGDGYLLLPEVIADIDNAAFAQARRRLREGIEGYPPLNRYRSIGLGHSMGGMLTAIVQDRHRPYDAVALLGSSLDGLPSQLLDALKPYAGDPEGARQNIVAILKARGIPAYIEPKSSPAGKGIFFGGDKRGVAMLKSTRTRLLVVPGSMSMLPGSWRPAAEQIDVPLFLAYGDQDLCEAPRAVPASFKNARDITLFVIENAGHSHFVFPSRETLFERVATWIRSR